MCLHDFFLIHHLNLINFFTYFVTNISIIHFINALWVKIPYISQSELRFSLRSIHHAACKSICSFISTIVNPRLGCFVDNINYSKLEAKILLQELCELIIKFYLRIILFLVEKLTPMFNFFPPKLFDLVQTFWYTLWKYSILVFCTINCLKTLLLFYLIFVYFTKQIINKYSQWIRYKMVRFEVPIRNNFIFIYSC